jgi:hypothetical protein
MAPSLADRPGAAQMLATARPWSPPWLLERYRQTSEWLLVPPSATARDAPGRPGVIVDEIHAVADNKRGSHRQLSASILPDRAVTRLTSPDQALAGTSTAWSSRR